VKRIVVKNSSELSVLKTSSHRTLGALLLLTTLGLIGCAVNSSSAWLPTSGPSTDAVDNAEAGKTAVRGSGIRVIDIDSMVARRVTTSMQRQGFFEAFPAVIATDYIVGSGDTLEVSVWEAPPASLFGVATLDPKNGASTSRLTALPEQMVNNTGTISVPFAGNLTAAGRTPSQIEAEIVKRLKGKANQPQVLVRVMKNASSNVTVVGEFVSSTRMQLTAKGERLLDAVAAAGGVRQPVGKMTVQLTRGTTVQSLPLSTIIQDPQQNIVLQAGDVVTALNKPLSFIALGATSKNEEIEFEAQGITLAQALARSGGLQDSRADAQGVFVFRFEDPAALDGGVVTTTGTTPDGKIPVIYRVDLKNPATFFAAQGFPMRDKDVIYVSNAPAAELQKFLNIVGSVISPVASARVIGARN